MQDFNSKYDGAAIDARLDKVGELSVELDTTKKELTQEVATAKNELRQQAAQDKADLQQLVDEYKEVTVDKVTELESEVWIANNPLIYRINGSLDNLGRIYTNIPNRILLPYKKIESIKTISVSNGYYISYFATYDAALQNIGADSYWSQVLNVAEIKEAYLLNAQYISIVIRNTEGTDIYPYVEDLRLEISTPQDNCTYIPTIIEDVDSVKKDISTLSGKIYGGSVESFKGKEDCNIIGFGISSVTGLETEFNGVSSSGYIDIGFSKQLVLSTNITANSFGLAFYNESHLFISGVRYTSQSNEIIEIPSSSKYLRFCSFDASQWELSLSIRYEYKGIDNLQESIDSLQIKPYRNNGVCALSEGKEVLLIGASYASQDNEWSSILSGIIGINIINKAVGGCTAMYHANRLYELSKGDTSSFITKEQFSSIQALFVMHVHNKDVYSLDEQYTSYTAKDYENSGVVPFPSAYEVGYEAPDAVYAQAYDYILKKWFEMCYSEKDNISSEWYGTKHGKPFVVMLMTNWRDGRFTFTEAIKKLSQKWQLPLCNIEDNIGFSVHAPINGMQVSTLYARDTTIDSGYTVGSHPLRGVDGDTKLVIQNRIAKIVSHFVEVQ